MDDTNSAGIMVPVRFVRREELEGPFDGLFYLRGRGSDDLPAAPTAADDRGTKLLQQLKEVAAADRSSEGDDECAICLRGFRDEETVRAMPACAHAFHHHCISEWLRRNPICPLCRRGLPDEEDDDVDWEGGAIICDWEEEEEDDEDLEDGEIICDWEEEEVDYSDERRTRRRIASSDDISST